MENQINYFIKKYEAIPEENWTTYTQLDSMGRRCAHGHCYTGNLCRDNTGESIEEKLLTIIARKYYGTEGIAQINNGQDPKYPQPTPKQRVLAFFYEIRDKHFPIKERIVYVTVDEKVRNLQEFEPFLN